MKQKRDIVIFNYSERITEALSQILTSEKITFHVAAGREEISLAAQTDSLKIITLPGTADSCQWLFSEEAPEISEPALLIDEEPESEACHRGLAKGIFHFIGTSVTREHLLKQIDSLREYQPADSPNEPKGLSLSALLFSLRNDFHFRSRTKENEKEEKSYRWPFAAGSTQDAVSERLPSVDVTEMKRGLEKEEFCLYYQPVMDLKTGRLAGFESLVRWEHSERGLIPPDEFIPAAEASGMIIPLGNKIIDEALSALKTWSETFDLESPFKVGINLSAKQFLLENIGTFITEKVEAAGLQPEYIAIEITESAFMDDMEKANLALLTLKSRGIKLYLDDFGTGYSSLTYLMHFPVDTLKIDKSFVEWMHIDEQSREIVKSVATLAGNLKMKTVAEGLETEEHVEMARMFGCDFGQGYFFSKPLPFNEATALVTNTFQDKSSLV